MFHRIAMCIACCVLVNIMCIALWLCYVADNSVEHIFGVCF